MQTYSSAPSGSAKPTPRPPPLRPGCKEFVAGLKRLSTAQIDENDSGKRKKTEPVGNAIYRKNYTNFLNFLTKEMEITYKMKRARG